MNNHPTTKATITDPKETKRSGEMSDIESVKLNQTEDINLALETFLEEIVLTIGETTDTWH